MVQQRGVAAAIIFTFLTCGIYGIYWFIALTNDVGRLSGDSSFTGGKHFLLTLVTCGIWSYIWSYQLGQQIAAAQRNRGIATTTDNAVVYLVLTIFGLGIVTYGLAQAEVNKLV